MVLVYCDGICMYILLFRIFFTYKAFVDLKYLLQYHMIMIEKEI